MLQRLIYNVTYDIATPESAEQGEFEESGFEHEEYHAESVSDVLYLIGLRGKPRPFRAGKDSAGRAAALYSELYI